MIGHGTQSPVEGDMQFNYILKGLATVLLYNLGPKGYSLTRMPDDIISKHSSFQ